METGKVKIERFTDYHDCGTPINPRAVHGQVEGAIVMGASETILEDVQFDEQGQILNPNLHGYPIMTIKDAPEIFSGIVDSYEPRGPFGAKEIGEGSTLPVLGAVAHAIAAHRFRTGPDPQTLEAQVLHDADKLDAIGAIGIARAFAFGGYEGQRLWAEVPPDYRESPSTRHEHTPVHEFRIKLLKIKDRLLTHSARRLAEERHSFMVAFYERLEGEVRGLV